MLYARESYQARRRRRTAQLAGIRRCLNRLSKRDGVLELYHRQARLSGEHLSVLRYEPTRRAPEAERSSGNWRTSDEQRNTCNGVLAARCGSCGMLRRVHVPGELWVVVPQRPASQLPGGRRPERHIHDAASWPDSAGDALLYVLVISGQLGCPGARPGRCAGCLTWLVSSRCRVWHRRAGVSRCRNRHGARGRVARVLWRGNAVRRRLRAV